MRARPPLPGDIKELMQLVRSGKLFDVQRWIAEGKRTVPPQPYWFSPLRVAIETGFHSMVQVLLEAGIDQDEKDHLLDWAVMNRNFEMVKLLVDYGADADQIRFEDVCWTGNPHMMHFFLERGTDMLAHQTLAHALCFPKRTHLSLIMRYRERYPEIRDQVNLALRHHARRGNLEWVSLLVWAGGNGHVPLPDIGEDPDPVSDTSALEEAIRFGRHAVVQKIGIDPKRDDMNRLLEEACSSEDWSLIEKVLDLGADPCGNNGEFPPMQRLISQFQWKVDPLTGIRSDYELGKAFDRILQFADRDGRWSPDDYWITRLRRELHKLGMGWMEKVVREFSSHKVCSRESLMRMIETQRFKQILGSDHNRLVRMVKLPNKQNTEDIRIPRACSVQEYA